ncbi:MAG TPA: alpha/beta hydrolase [Thermoanaerobaculia bacterium]
MPDRLPPGPYRHLRLSDGTDVPYYIIPFDKQGRCEGPETRKHLLDSAKAQGYTDIFLFSHGWNNDWTAATERYENFIEGYMGMRQKHSLPMPPGYKPLLVGIFWPSTALVFTEDEVGPGIAADDPEAMDAAVAEERQEVREVAEALPPDADVERFYELAQKEALTEEEALELARILAPLYRGENDELEAGGSSSAEEILAVWKAAAPPQQDFSDASDFGTVGGGTAGGPQAAGFGDALRRLDPRQPIRLFTVWQMKDRAGTVGARGVSPLLRDLLKATEEKKTRVHLIGHSYGGKVVLSAVAAAELPRKVESILLLQPAVSHLCFAEKVPGTDRPGGYRAVLDRVNKPVLTTFSAHDVPLTRVFHLAVRRADDLGEAKIAAEGEPPSQYAALGGFGPRKAGEKLIDIVDRPQKYDLTQGPRVYGIRATRTIGGHGDVSNESTWWALYNLASG